MIQGYPERGSVAAGGRLLLRVATRAPRFRVAFHRWGDGFVAMGVSRELPGKDAAAGRPDVDWGWPEYTFSIPRGWPSGVYVAHLEVPGGPPLGVAMSTAAALFVVRGEGKRPLLYKLPLATYHAYNVTGGGCFYFRPPWSEAPPGGRVTFRRPGGGIGGETHGALDAHDTTSPRQTFAHWDARFVRWLVRSGYDPEFCTDLDVHEGLVPGAGHRLMVSAGHDEYWSEAARDRVERYAAGGGNVAFFGGNTCWWRIHVVDDGAAMVCHQGGPRGALDHWWPETGARRPEDALTGVSYRHGGGWWEGPRRARGYVVQDGEHWVFANTGLRTGSVFGEGTSPPLPGYECDGAPLARLDEATGLAALSPDAGRCGTPPGFRLLAVAALDGRWDELPAREGHAAGEGIHAAVMGCHRPGGTVFTAGTTDWAHALDQDPRVAAITRNVLDRLLGR